VNQTSILLLVVASAAGLMGWGPAALVSLPELALGEQPWRLASGHFAHADLNHWMMNSAGLLACGLLFERACRAHFTGLLITGMVFVNVWLLAGSSLSAYCGLSGALNAVFVGGCLMRYSSADTWAQQSSLRYLWLLLPLLDLLKIGVEFCSGQALFSDSSWASTPLAHLAGWLAGGVYVAVWSSIKSCCADTRRLARNNFVAYCLARKTADGCAFCPSRGLSLL